MSAHTLRRLQLVATIGWTLLGIPTFWLWLHSVAWIVAISWWTTVATHAAGWAGARAEEAGTDA